MPLLFLRAAQHGGAVLRGVCGGRGGRGGRGRDAYQRAGRGGATPPLAPPPKNALFTSTTLPALPSPPQTTYAASAAGYVGGVAWWRRGGGEVRVKRLAAPSAGARQDRGDVITFGGQVFEDGSCVVRGTEVVESVKVSDGQVSVVVQASEAVVLWL
jgi:hypothetical protein